MPSTSFHVHLRKEEKLSVRFNSDLVPGTHGVNIEIGSLTITVFGSTKEICEFRDAIAAGISPRILED